MHKIILTALLGASMLSATPALADQPVWGQNAHDNAAQNDWHDRKGEYDQRNDPYRHEERRPEDRRRDDYRQDDHRYPVAAYDSHGRYRDPRPLGRQDHIWRGRDGRYHCRRDNGTEGLIIGAAVGALVGRSLDNGRDRTLGAVALMP